MCCSRVGSTGFSLWGFIGAWRKCFSVGRSQDKACWAAYFWTACRAMACRASACRVRLSAASRAEGCATGLRGGSCYGIPQAEACATCCGTFFSLRGVIRWCAVLLLAFAASPAFATTYFVAAGGSDSNSGTDTLHPWQTISKVNAAAFSAGDSILFNRGDVWYGTSLVVPSSGSSGSPITFGAYGSGANPIVKGSTLLATSGFTLAPNLMATVFSLHDSGTNSSTTA